MVDKVYQDAEEWQESIVVQLAVRAMGSLEHLDEPERVWRIVLTNNKLIPPSDYIGTFLLRSQMNQALSGYSFVVSAELLLKQSRNQW